MAYQKRGEKNGWALFLLVLAGIVLGGFLGYLAKDVPFLSWLGFSYEFGMTGEPVVIDLKVFVMTFKVLFDISIASILGIVLAIFIYRKL